MGKVIGGGRERVGKRREESNTKKKGIELKVHYE